MPFPEAEISGCTVRRHRDSVGFLQILLQGVVDLLSQLLGIWRSREALRARLH